MTATTVEDTTAPPPVDAGARVVDPAVSARVVYRARVATVCVALAVLAFVQEPGKLSRDTKLDLYVEPAGLLARALQVWDPTTAFGGLQNQAYGYLFPMGPFFLVADLLNLPMWIAQRAWMALLLCVAFVGMVKLCDALGVGTPWTRVLAGLAFALSPRVATTLGPISSEILPLCVAPWALLPLVRPLGRHGARGAAALSGFAILCAGGVNAVATLAACVPPAIWLLTREPGPARRRLASWWVAATTAACLWWAVPLVVLGKYSFPFLDYIETSAVTTGGTSLPEILRGGSHWLAGLAAEGGPWWSGGWVIETNPLVVLYTLVLVVLGLVGLAARGTRERLFLVACLLVGCALIGFGYAGAGGPFLAGAERDLLDGVLSPFRNVHKFDLVVRIPLVVGLCHLLSLPFRRPLGGLVRGTGLVAVAVVAAPFLLGDVVPTGAYRSVPGYWTQAADWLSDRGGGSRTLLLPGSSFGAYKWGRPMDEPLRALMSTPWAVRDQIPLGGEGSIRVLDAVGERVADGRGAPGLAAFLARAGVRYVVVRNDLDWPRTGAVKPVLVHQALRRSGGFDRVAGFGPGVAAQASDGDTVSDYGQDVLRQAVEVYEVGPPASLVTSYPADGVVAVTGGPEALLAADGSGLLTGRATVLDGDPLAGGVRPDRTLLADGMRRREVNFGAAFDNASQTLGPSQPTVQRRRAVDYLPFAGVAQTTAGHDGLREVTASSSAADPDALRLRGAEYHPAAATDGNLDSVWISGSRGGAREQWWQATLAGPRPVRRVTVTVLDTALFDTRPTSLRVLTSSGATTVPLGQVGQPVSVELDGAATSFVRISLPTLSADSDPAGLVGLREVSVDGAEPGRHLRLAPAGREAAGPTAVVTTRVAGARSPCVAADGAVACNPRLGRLGEEEGAFARRFTLPTRITAGPEVAVEPRPGPLLDARLVAELLPAGVTVDVSSRLVADPRSGPAALVDGDPTTGWLASHADTEPYVDVRWQGARTVDRVVVETSPVVGASRPSRVVVSTPAGYQAAEIGTDGTAAFAPVVTDRLRLTFPDPTPVLTADPAYGSYQYMPLGFTGLAVPGVFSGSPTRTDAALPPAACGSGPLLELDGRPARTALAASATAVLRGDRLSAQPCGEVSLDPGDHLLVAPDTAFWRVTGVALAPEGWWEEPPEPAREVRVESWEATRRVVRMAAGGGAVLAVAENANAGWRATVDGAELRPVRLDGWRQGWVVPAGGQARVVLEYGPQRTYLAGLLGGGLAVLVLLGWAFVGSRREPAAGPAAAGVRPWQVAVLLGLVVLIGGWWGLAAAVTVGATVGVARRVPRDPLSGLRGVPVLAGVVGVVAAGMALGAAGAGQGWWPWPGQVGLPPQVLALTALAVLAVALLPTAASTGAGPLRPAGGSTATAGAEPTSAGAAPAVRPGTSWRWRAPGWSRRARRGSG